MKTRSLFQGLVLAVCLSLAAIPLAMALHAVLSPRLAFNTLVAILAYAAILDTLRRSGSTTGRAVLGVTCAAALCGGVLFLTGYECCLLSAGLLWFARSVITYSSLLMAAADLGVTVLGLAAAGSAYGSGRSLIVGIWIFLLSQAFTAKIPRSLSAAPTQIPTASRDPFDAAHASAEYALRQIIGRVRA